MDDMMLRFEGLKDRMQGEFAGYRRGYGLALQHSHRFLNHEKDPKYSTMKALMTTFVASNEKTPSGELRVESDIKTQQGA